MLNETNDVQSQLQVVCLHDPVALAPAVSAVKASAALVLATPDETEPPSEQLYDTVTFWFVQSPRSEERRVGKLCKAVIVGFVLSILTGPNVAESEFPALSMHDPVAFAPAVSAVKASAALVLATPAETDSPSQQLYDTVTFWFVQSPAL